MNKGNKTETKNGTTQLESSTHANASPQTKRYDDMFKAEAFENWISVMRCSTGAAAGATSRAPDGLAGRECGRWEGGSGAGAP